MKKIYVNIMFAMSVLAGVGVEDEECKKQMK